MFFSQLYQVVYSTVVIMTALFSKIFLSKQLTGQQWLAIFSLTIGLAVSAFGTQREKEPNDQQLLGILVTLVATCIFALNYVYNECILTGPNAPPAEKAQALIGVYSLSLLSFWIVFYTLPRWRSLVLDEIEEFQGNVIVIIIFYILLTAASFGHSLAYYQLLRLVGAVSTGVLQSLRAVTVFVMSSLLFCNTHREQCYNFIKFISTVLVINGLLYFSYLKSLEGNSHSQVSSQLNRQGKDPSNRLDFNV
jgi:drug/metabolite transporter (DMT)-like permease